MDGEELDRQRGRRPLERHLQWGDEGPWRFVVKGMAGAVELELRRKAGFEGIVRVHAYAAADHPHGHSDGCELLDGAPCYVWDFLFEAEQIIEKRSADWGASGIEAEGTYRDLEAIYRDEFVPAEIPAALVEREHELGTQLAAARARGRAEGEAKAVAVPAESGSMLGGDGGGDGG